MSGHHTSGRPGQGLAKTEAEILAEKASALGRAGERLGDALREAWALLARLDAAPSGDEQRMLLAQYRAARARAAHARLMLIIQREAVGLRHHRVVDQEFPEPPPRPRR